MKMLLAPLGLVLVCASLSCSPSSEPLPPEETPYLKDYSVIENLITDLETSWIQREIDPYVNLFAPEFVFVFQEDDADGIPEGFWNRDDDSTGVARIFDSSQVTAIRANLQFGAPEPNQQTTITEEPATRIVVFDTFLDVDLNGGETTLRVDGDVQHFYCRMGDESKGEDPSRWYIIEWKDLGRVTLSLVEPNTVSQIKKLLQKKFIRPSVESTSWSSIKAGAGGERPLPTEKSTISTIKQLLSN